MDEVLAAPPAVADPIPILRDPPMPPGYVDPLTESTLDDLTLADSHGEVQGSSPA